MVRLFELVQKEEEHNMEIYSTSAESRSLLQVKCGDLIDV